MSSVPVAIYHCSVKSVGRGSGRCATAAAAYRSGSEIADERTGEAYDYTRKQGVEHAEIVLPDDAARNDINWARDRAALWNAAELAEKRKDARVAREYEVALPAELSPEQRLELVREFSRDIANRYGCAVDFAIHAPHRQGDQRNHHAHLLATTRQITATGMGDKTTVEWSDTDRKKRGLPTASQEMVAVRERWAEFSNRALERHGHVERVDHRTLEAQRQDALQRGDTEKAAELDREPTKHLGVAATALERRGERTDLGEINRRIAEAAEYGRLEREKQALDRSIVDVSGDLAAALKERDSFRELQRRVQPDGDLAMEARRQARAHWEAMKAAQAAQARDKGAQRGQGVHEVQGGQGIQEVPGSERPGHNPFGRLRPETLAKLPMVYGFRADQTLVDRIVAAGGRAADPRELERLMREWAVEQERAQRDQERDREREYGLKQGRDWDTRTDRHEPGRQPGYGDPQAHRDREWDRGWDRGRDSGRSSTDQEQQRQRERDIEHRRHRDRGLDR